MPDVGFGGTSSPGAWTDQWVQTDGFGLVTGRAMANGNTSCVMTAIFGYISGRFASRTVSMALGGAGTSSFGVSAAGSAQGTGYVGTGLWMFNGGSANARWTFNGSCFYARSSSGGSTNDSYGYVPGDLGGAYRYIQGPTVPTSFSLTLLPNPTTLQINWAGPSDDGGTANTGYRVEWWYSDAPATKFTQDVGASVLTTTLTGLTPGKTVVARVAARNYVSTTAGTVGVYSATLSATLPSGGRVWNGSAWVPGTVRVWNGSAWVPAIVRVWSGSAWVAAQ